MYKSLFIDGTTIYGVDYSNREDCVGVSEITEKEYETEKQEKIKIIEEKMDIELLIESEKTEDEKIENIEPILI